MTKLKEDNVILNLLIYFIGFSGIYNLYQGYQDFLNYILNPETAIVFLAIIVLYYAGLIFFHIYSIILLVKEKNNAIMSTKLLIILLIIVDIIQLLWIYYIKEGYAFILGIIIWIIFYFIFLVFMYKSKEVNERFPREKIRKKSIAIILFVLTLLLSLILWVFMFGIQYLVNKGIIPI